MRRINSEGNETRATGKEQRRTGNVSDENGRSHTFPSGYSSQRAPTVHLCFSSTARTPGSAAKDSSISLAVSSSGRPGRVSMRSNLQNWNFDSAACVHIFAGR